MKALFDISGKTAIVTGGSSGIGAMIARGFVENGVKTYISARKEGPLMAKAEELSEYGTCIPIQADLSSLEGIERFVAQVSEQEDHDDILINNAGANWVVPIDDFPENGWDKVMTINIKSMFFMTQKCLPLLRKNGTQEDPARIVNIASNISRCSDSGNDAQGSPQTIASIWSIDCSRQSSATRVALSS